MNKLQKLEIKSTKRLELIDITSKLNQFIKTFKIPSGILILYTPHTTAALTVNEHADPSVKEDILNSLARLFPEQANYAHTEGNADAHIKATLVGPSLSLIVEDGQLLLGTWQGVFFCEFDGPRSRQIYIKAIPSI